MQNIIRLNLGTVNCYLLPVQKGFILIDTGGYTFQGNPTDNKRELLEKLLIENGCIPGKLRLVILTHGDVDHIANGKYLQDKYKVKIAIHKADTPLVSNLSVEKVLSNFKFNSPFLSFMSLLMRSLIIKTTKRIVGLYQEFQPDEFIDEDYDLSQYGLDARILYLPGHTNGSIGILTKDGDLLAGDIFANIKKPVRAINAYNFSDLQKSIQKLKELNIRTVYPGHGNPFQFSEL